MSNNEKKQVTKADLNFAIIQTLLTIIFGAVMIFTSFGTALETTMTGAANTSLEDVSVMYRNAIIAIGLFVVFNISLTMLYKMAKKKFNL